MRVHTGMKSLLRLFAILIVVAMATASSAAEVDEALGTAQGILQGLQSGEGMNSKLIQPSMDSGVNFHTFVTDEEFSAGLVCSSASPIVTIQMLPDGGTLADIGEVQLVASYDMGLDGTMDYTVSASHVAGMCSNGFVANCNPPGSFEGCTFYKWTNDDGKIVALDEDVNNRPISLTDLRGCFCFNRSCGSPIVGMTEQVMSYFGTGILNELRKVNKDMVIAEVNKDLAGMTLDYIGTHTGNCHSSSAASMGVSDVAALKNQYHFNAEALAAAQPSGSLYDFTKQAFDNTYSDSDFRSCKVYANVGIRQQTVTRNPKAACEKVATDPQDPYAICDSGMRHRGAAFANEVMRTFNEYYRSAAYYGVEVLCGNTWVTAWSTGGPGTFGGAPIGCSAVNSLALSQSGMTWPRHKYICGDPDDASNLCLAASDLCRCVIMDDVFTCFSPSMGPGDGTTIVNGEPSGTPATVNGQCMRTTETEACNKHVCPDDYAEYDTDANCTAVCSQACFAVTECQVYEACSSWECDASGVLHDTEADCTSACAGTCAPVTSCPVEVYQCSLDGTTYGTEADCDAGCSMVFAVGSGAAYDKLLYQGCEEITDPVNQCKVYEEDETCELFEEVTDGIYTYQNGQKTGLEPMTECRLIEGNHRSLHICEPWWEKERLYRCDRESEDYDQVKQRAERIGATTGVDGSGEWTSQGDIRFDEDGNPTDVVFDPDVQFTTNAATCEPACLVTYPSQDTNIYIKGLGYETQDQVRDIVVSRACVENAGVWECPLEQPCESIKQDCTCFDEDSFSEAVSQIAMMREVPSDMICTSGEEVGVCGPEDEGVNSMRTVCITDPSFSGDDLTAESLLDCEPNLWRNDDGIPEQTHKLRVLDDYSCWAYVEGYSEAPGGDDTDNFDNNIGVLNPVSAWFDVPVAWAAPIAEDFVNDGIDALPDPVGGCVCSTNTQNGTTPDGSDPTEGSTGYYECEWNNDSVGEVVRMDLPELRPSDQDPFGDTFLVYTRTGSWSGVHHGACTLGSGQCERRQICPATGDTYTDVAECEGNCVQAGECRAVANPGVFECAGTGSVSYTHLRAHET